MYMLGNVRIASVLFNYPKNRKTSSVLNTKFVYFSAQILFEYLFLPYIGVIRRVTSGELLTKQYLLTCGAEPFLRSRQLCGHTRTAQHFMESEDSSPCSQEHSTGPYSEPDRPSPHHPLSPRWILILSIHPHLGLPSGLLFSGFPTNILNAFLFSLIRATCPGHFVLLDLIILIMFCKEYKL
jgi:hypothetical protein